MSGTLVFPTGNIAPDGSVVKATSIDPSVMESGTFRMTGQARVFTSEVDAIAAIKDPSEPIQKGNVIVLVGCGPMGTGMEETYQLTSALKHLPWGKFVPLITDARFSGVSTGACIGHIGPEGLAGGPIGKLLNGDWIEIYIDTNQGFGSVNLVGDKDGQQNSDWGVKELQRRTTRNDLREASQLPDATRLWAAMQGLCGGTWGGCVYDADMIINKLRE